MIRLASKPIHLWLFVSLIFIAALYYLWLPAPRFPTAPPGALRSQEPGDLETPYRRAFYTNYSRSEILKYYSQQFYLPGQFLLNYPPEDAFSLIRDQTHSSWLQELVHPWRESLYINGFYPTKPTEQIYIDGVHYLNKITLHYVPSTLVNRYTVLLLVAISIYFLWREYEKI